MRLPIPESLTHIADMSERWEQLGFASYKAMRQHDNRLAWPAASKRRRAKRESARLRPMAVPAAPVLWTPCIQSTMLSAELAGSTFTGPVEESDVDRAAETVPLIEAQRASALMTPPHMLWGNISDEVARKAGALARVRSVCLLPVVPTHLIQEFMGLIPAHVFPDESDTAETLAARLGDSDWLDDNRFYGTKKKRRTNAQTWQQPRRKTFGVRRSRGTAEDGAAAATYYAYPAPRYDYSCTAFPREAYAFTLFLWHVAREHLTEEQQAQPPNCQLQLLEQLRL